MARSKDWDGLAFRPLKDPGREARELFGYVGAWAPASADVAAGWGALQLMHDDADLDALRDREDFQKLVADLEAKTNKHEQKKNESEARNQESAKTP